MIEGIFMASMVEVKCKGCKEPFMARVADRKRGWGEFCSKSCKATKQNTNKRKRQRYPREFSSCVSMESGYFGHGQE